MTPEVNLKVGAPKALYLNPPYNTLVSPKAQHWGPPYYIPVLHTDQGHITLQVGKVVLLIMYSPHTVIKDQDKGSSVSPAYCGPFHVTNVITHNKYAKELYLFFYFSHCVKIPQLLFHITIITQGNATFVHSTVCKVIKSIINLIWLLRIIIIPMYINVLLSAYGKTMVFCADSLCWIIGAQSVI